MASPYDNIPGKIFIGGIPPITTQETIQHYFEQFGELCDCVLMQDKPTGKSRGFGFVTYKDSKIVDKVLTKPHIIDGKEVDCKRAVPRDQQGEIIKEETPGKTKKLFVGGLPQNLSEEQFRSYFEQFGTIEDCVIIIDKETGKSRGFGFVTYDNEDSVEQVIQRYYENKIDGKWIECKRAQPKDIGMASTSKKGNSKFPNGGRGQGFYQDNSSSKSSRSQFGQENYGEEFYQGGYMQSMMRNNPYDSGKYPSQGYGDYNSFNTGYGNMYDPNFGYGGGYPGDFSGGYGNVYPGAYNNPYGGYNPGYSGNMGYSGAQGNYGGAGGYNAGGYGYNMQGGYGINNNQNQGMRGMQSGNYSKYGQYTKQSQDSEQTSLFTQEDQSGVGPIKGTPSNKKQEAESRYYTPY